MVNIERQTLSIIKACEVTGVCRRTMYNWIAARKVQYTRTAGGSIRIFVDTLFRDEDAADDARYAQQSLSTRQSL